MFSMQQALQQACNKLDRIIFGLKEFELSIVVGTNQFAKISLIKLENNPILELI